MVSAGVVSSIAGIAADVVGLGVILSTVEAVDYPDIAERACSRCIVADIVGRYTIETPQ